MRPQVKKHPPLNFKQLVVLGLSASVGVFLGWLVEHTAVNEQPVNPLALFACFFVAIFIHELGHVAGGLSARFQVMSFTVGPLMLRRRPDGWRFRRSPIRIGGLVTAMPVGMEDLRRRTFVLVVAGPIASFLSGGTIFILARAFAEHEWANWLSTYGVVSAGLGVLSLIPMRKFYLSDGARIWELLRSPEKCEQRTAAMAIAAAAMLGTRPRDWDPELISKAMSIGDGSATEIAANVLAYERAMDRREFDIAEKHLEAAVAMRDKCPATLKSGLALDATFFYSIARHDAAIAREWWSSCDQRYIEERYSLWMTESALFLAEGKWSEAARKADEAKGALSKAQYPGFAIAARDWLNIISERAQAGLRSAKEEQSSSTELSVSSSSS